MSGTLNWSILGLYVVASIAIGWRTSGQIETSENLFLGQKKTPWWAIGISILATYVSALSFLGGPAWAYEEGLSALAVHINYPIVIFIVIVVCLPFFYNAGVPSIYAYLERRFGVRSRVLMAGLFLITQGLSSATLLASTAWVLSFVTDLSVVNCILIVAAISVAYTVFGGITAVIWTDVLQALILLVGAVIVLVNLIPVLPNGLMAALSDLKAQGKTNALITDPDFTRATTIWAGALAMTLYHSTVYGANQMIIQRAIGAASIGDAKKAFLLAGYIAVFIYALFMGIGLLLRVVYAGAEVENGNTMILEFAQTLAIPGLMGLLASAVIAASMSSLDSALNSMATVSVVDFAKRFSSTPLSERQTLNLSRGLTVFWGLVLLGPAILIANETGSVLELVGKFGSYFIGAKLALFGLGFFSKSVRETALLIGVAAGFAAVAYAALQTDIAWPWYAVIGGVVNIAVAMLLSPLFGPAIVDWHPETIRAQQIKMREQPEPVGRWSAVPGVVDAPVWGLPVLFVAILGSLFAFNFFIPN
ncbi:MAG: sodium/solute symporter [Pseudomonadota bacterium]